MVIKAIQLIDVRLIMLYKEEYNYMYKRDLVNSSCSILNKLLVRK